MILLCGEDNCGSLERLYLLCPNQLTPLSGAHHRVRVADRQGDVPVRRGRLPRINGGFSFSGGGDVKDDIWTRRRRRRRREGGVAAAAAAADGAGRGRARIRR